MPGCRIQNEEDEMKTIILYINNMILKSSYRHLLFGTTWTRQRFWRNSSLNVFISVKWIQILIISAFDSQRQKKFTTISKNILDRTILWTKRWIHHYDPAIKEHLKSWKHLFLHAPKYFVLQKRLA